MNNENDKTIGTVSRDFSSLVFFIIQLLLVPIGMHRNSFEFFRIFVELFVFVIDSPIMNPPGSWLESLGSKAIFPNIKHMSLCSYSNLQSIFRMIVPLKVVVSSLKSVKRLPSVQNDSPVMNTPRSQLLSVFGTSIRTGLQKNFMVTNRPRSQDSSMY
jgi:hypothetical protein